MSLQHEFPSSPYPELPRTISERIQELDALLNRVLPSNSFLILVFDLDDTLVSNDGVCYHGILELLYELKENFADRIILTMASYNLDAVNMLRIHNMSILFDIIFYGRVAETLEQGKVTLAGDGKVGMLAGIAALLKRRAFQRQVEPTICPCNAPNNTTTTSTEACRVRIGHTTNDVLTQRSIDDWLTWMILFDDQKTNVTALGCSQAHVQAVDCRYGVTWDTLMTGIEGWARGKK